MELNDGQKTRLLSLGLEPDRPGAMPDGDEQRGDLLCDILRRPLPTDGRGEPAATVAQSHPVFRLVAGPPLRELLLNPKTDIAVLRKIKEYAKTMGQNAGTETEKDAFLAVYLAAIAAAGLLHSDRITEHSDTDLVRFLDFFARVSWMPRDMADLISRATGPRRILAL
ncbi:MAG TPA: hypothetical protein PKH24_00140 [Sedimentisphaerales bacterium]|nr:hypothetical protein [Sedimentisphaerales bacterium]HNU27699.1 hypothetical protein [Sedimentisphaerales bacterium]